jgi:acyl-CoA synthetase (AMP-forming)/AMP-acid ligase II/thioesterase domain-containing protein/acyl carrier protein
MNSRRLDHLQKRYVGEHLSASGKFEVNSRPAETISDVLRQQATVRPNATALLAPHRSPSTFAELWEHVQVLVAALQSHGVDRTARVAVVLPNGPEMAVAFLGVAACAACAPLNPAYGASEFRFYLEDARARVVIVRKDESGPVRSVADEMGLTVLEIDVAASTQAGQLRIVSGPIRHGISLSFSQNSDIALVLHTSGTTGRPKLVALSHADLVNYARKLSRHLVLDSPDRCLNVMPLFHSHGLRGALLSSLASGGSVICSPGFENQAFFDWVAEFEPTWYTAVPTIHQSVIARGALYRQRAPQHRFRFVRSTSAALPTATINAMEELFRAPVITAYGMTEASPIASTALPPSRRAPGSLGKPAPGLEVSIVDGSGRLLPAGHTGEVRVRGDGVFKGYENNPEANALAFVDGWFRTGDQGHLDEQGYLYVSGRLKEVVNRGGEKISPREVDEALLEHYAVEQAAAFAAPHPTLGEDLLAAVVVRAGVEIDGAALRTFLSERLSTFKVPSQILVVDEIPKGPTGKVQRDRLHEVLRHLIRPPYVAPRDDVERQLAEIWKSLLGKSEVGIDDDFFALGGDSLLAVSAFVDVEYCLGKTLRLATLFDAPTIRQLAKIVRSDDEPVKNSTAVAVQSKGKRSPLFFMSGWGSQILVLEALSRELGDDQPFFAIDPTVIEVGPGETLTVEQVAARIIEDMRHVQPVGPYNLAGYSMGGKFVWEIAQQLQAAGETVSLLALLDRSAPGFPSPRSFLVRSALHVRYALTLAPAEARDYLWQRFRELRRFFAPRRRTLFSHGDDRAASVLVQRLERTADALYQASKRYVPAAYAGGMVLVRAALQPIRPGMDDSDPLMGWGPLVRGGVMVRALGSSHGDMLNAAYARELANILSSYIDMPATAQPPRQPTPLLPI